MRFAQFTISNFKCFDKPQTVKLLPGFNVFTAKNNTGKSALIEALSMQFDNKPHITRHYNSSLPNHVPQNSIVKFNIEIEQNELIKLIRKYNYSFCIPCTDQANSDNMQEMYERFIGQAHLEFWLKREGRSDIIASKNPVFTFSGEQAVANDVYIEVQLDSGGIPHAINQKPWLNYIPNSIDILLGLEVHWIIYAFKAERMNLATSPVGKNRMLEPNARNLPEVLQNLQVTRARFDKYNLAVRTVSLCVRIE